LICAVDQLLRFMIDSRQLTGKWPTNDVSDAFAATRSLDLGRRVASQA
jgi:hypothetical protein